MRALFLVHGQLTSHCVLVGQKGRPNSLGSPIRALIPLQGLHPHDLSSSQRPNLLIPSLGGSGFQPMNFKRTPTFSLSHRVLLLCKIHFTYEAIRLYVLSPRLVVSFLTCLLMQRTFVSFMPFHQASQ